MEPLPLKVRREMNAVVKGLEKMMGIPPPNEQTNNEQTSPSSSSPSSSSSLSSSSSSLSSSSPSSDNNARGEVFLSSFLDMCKTDDYGLYRTALLPPATTTATPVETSPSSSSPFILVLFERKMNLTSLKHCTLEIIPVLASKEEALIQQMHARAKQDRITFKEVDPEKEVEEVPVHIFLFFIFFFFLFSFFFCFI
jgi:cytoskeletal protein RodZ